MKGGGRCNFISKEEKTCLRFLPLPLWDIQKHFMRSIYLHVLDQDEKDNVFYKFQYLTETNTFVMLIIIQDYKLPIIHYLLCFPI